MSANSITYRLNDLPAVAAELITQGDGIPCWTFNGAMGAGKTTLIAEICRQWGVTEETSSPTYAIVHEYAGRKGPIYHMDAYRLKSAAEAFDAGLEELLSGPEQCLVEWPEKVQELLPECTFAINIESEGDYRHLTYQINHE